jgi:lipoprotein-anchoring transpeptidase ErfK/SrfK
MLVLEKILRSCRIGALLILSTGLSWSAPALVPAELAMVQAQAEAIASHVNDLKNSGQPWIQIDISTQRLVAWEGNTPVYSVIVSTGDASDPTPTGTFEIQSMHPVARMRGEDYDIPDVPHVMYYSGNYAIHGTYWHNSFGIPVSNGCVNVAPNHAEWVFNWVSLGTPVVVQE